VPTYEYHCDGCGRDFEVKQRISEEPLTSCDQCGGRVRRLISPAPFILKGEGWYVTEYPSASRKQAMESEKSSGKTTPAGEKAGGEKSASSTDGASTSSSAPASPSAPSSSAASSD
jgi:putative FmdB family regulatory protein